LFPPGNGGCGGKIQEKKILLVHDQKLQTMIENKILYNASVVNMIFEKTLIICLIMVNMTLKFNYEVN
jgi:hypothetical protein